ncbi:MAG TPA: hypothetical protein VMU34_13320, partial [Mycobacterium sp.]|nr:hypothetical protein [Mycobacterium sp.]
RVVIGHGLYARAAHGSDFGCEPADLVILRGDRLACGAQLTLAIREPDFGGTAPTRLVRGAVRQFVHQV